MKNKLALLFIGENLKKPICANIFIRVCFIILLGILVSCSGTPASTSSPPVSNITVVMDNNYPPYTFVDDKGELQGILIDQWRLWEEKTGVKVEIIGLPWGEALERMKAGEFDVIDTLFYTEERAKVYDFGKPYAKISVRVFFRKSISGISNAKNLKGFRVAVKEGDANVEYLQKQGITSLVYYDSYEDIVLAATNNEENVFVIDEPPALYFLFKSDIRNEFNFSEPLYSGEFHRAVKKGDTATLELVTRGFDSISAQKYREIDNRWFGTSQTSELALIMPYLGGVLFLALVVIISLFFFNRTLQSRVRERTDELRKSADQYRAVVESQTELIVRWKPDRTRTFVNDAYCRYYGFTHEQAMSNDFMSLIVEEDRQTVEEKITRLMSGVTNTETESHRVIKPDGSIGWQEWTEKAIRNENGEVIEFQSVGRDITERKRVEDALLAEKEFTEHALNSQVDTFFVLELETGQAIRWNTAFKNQSGYSDEEIRSQKAPESYYDKQDTEKTAKAIQQIQNIGTATLELSLITKDGHRIPTEYTVNAINDAAGVPKYIIAIGRNITKRKQAEEALRESEERFRLIAENSTDMISRHDPNGVYLYVSPACRALVGFEPEELVGHSAFEFIHPDDQAKLEQSRQMVVEEQLVDVISFRSLRKDGNYIWLESTSRSLKDKDSGEIIEIQVSSRDITERKQTEDALQESEEKFRNLFENMNDGFALHKIILDEDRKPVDYEFIEVNPIFTKRVGMRAEDIIKHTASELFPKTEQAWIDVFGQVALSGQPIQFTSYSVELNKHYETRLYCPRPGYFAGLFADITERKLAEEKLQESEVRYRTLFEDSPVPLLEEDFSAVKNYIDELRESGIKDFRSYFENHPEATNKCINMVQVIDVNKAAIKWQGSSNKDELTGSLGQFISASETESFIEELISLIEDGTHYEATISRTTKDGNPIHLIVNGTVAPGYENTWGRVLVSILDITESKIAEENLVKAYDTTLWGWAKALEFRDKETEGHSRRVVEITLKFAQALGIVDEDELVNIRRGAILHDIGKLSIPDEILLKPGQLTEGEWQIMSQHPWIGYKLLAPIEFLSGSLDIVRYHHEKWDGSGYLSGLKGEEIPLAARIFAVVDVWDAVQAERPYKKAWTRKKAIQHLQTESGKQFDPRIVTVFLDLVEQGKI